MLTETANATVRCALMLLSYQIRPICLQLYIWCTHELVIIDIVVSITEFAYCVAIYGLNAGLPGQLQHAPKGPVCLNGCRSRHPDLLEFDL